MDWDQTFVPFLYEQPRAALHTVLKLNPTEIERFECASQEYEHRQSGLSKKEVENTLLLETAYSRYTPAALRVISRKHAVLSNHFKRWIDETSGIRAKQEPHQIDVTFDADGLGFLADFKIAYQGNTKRAIREALGQILDYNNYPSQGQP